MSRSNKSNKQILPHPTYPPPITPSATYDSPWEHFTDHPIRPIAPIGLIRPTLTYTSPSSTPLVPYSPPASSSPPIIPIPTYDSPWEHFTDHPIRPIAPIGLIRPTLVYASPTRLGLPHERPTATLRRLAVGLVGSVLPERVGRAQPWVVGERL